MLRLSILLKVFPNMEFGSFIGIVKEACILPFNDRAIANVRTINRFIFRSWINRSDQSGCIRRGSNRSQGRNWDQTTSRTSCRMSIYFTFDTAKLINIEVFRGMSVYEISETWKSWGDEWMRTFSYQSLIRSVIRMESNVQIPSSSTCPVQMEECQDML